MMPWRSENRHTILFRDTNNLDVPLAFSYYILSYEGKLLTLPIQRWPLEPGGQDSLFLSMVFHPLPGPWQTAPVHLKCSRTPSSFHLGHPTPVAHTMLLRHPGPGFGFDPLILRQKAPQYVAYPWGQPVHFSQGSLYLNISFPFTGKSAIIICYVFLN